MVYLSPLPCWQHKTCEELRQAARELLAHIQAEIDAERAATGRKPLGIERVLDQRPTDLPQSTKRSPAPIAHAATRQAFFAMLAVYRRFVAAFRDASSRLRNGELGVEFPPGSFPPRLSFVPEVDPSPA